MHDERPSQVWARWDDATLITRVRRGETVFFEGLVRRHNRTVYRATRALIRSEEKAEHAMMESYLRAYEELARADGAIGMGAWLSSVALRTAHGRLRRSARSFVRGGRVTLADAPEPRATRRLEEAIDGLPDLVRVVFVLVTIERMTLREIALVLGIAEATVVARLHLARAALKSDVLARVEEHGPSTFTMAPSRLDAVLRPVMDALAASRAVSCS